MHPVRSLDKLRAKQQHQQRNSPNAIVIALATFIAVAALNLIASNSWISFAGCPGDTTNPLLISTFPISQRITAAITRKQKGGDDHDDPSFINMTNYNGPARAFPIYPHPFPCLLLPKSQAIMKTTPASEGLLFQRPFKTGSTTMAGVVMRIARRKARQRLKQVSSSHATPSLSRNQAIRRLSFAEREYLTNLTTKNMTFFCQHRSNHGSAVNYRYAQRDVRRSFLMTLVRNPTKRCISQFFHFGVSAQHQEPTDPVFQTYLMSKMRAHPVLSDASLNGIPTSPDHPKTNLTMAVQKVLDGYDFIAVTERFDESLVALKMILKLDFADILYTRHRSGGSFTNGGDKTRPCIYVVPSFITEGMKRFFKSDKWKTRIRGEILLYQAGSKSLDLTIDRLGRDEFSQQLAHFLRINKAAQATCEPREVGMCSASGEPVTIENRTCIIWSEGCSDSCLDEINADNE